MSSEINENGGGKTQSFVVLSTGLLVSHYKLIERIGAGGMGEVYLAEDTKLSRKVALKFLPPHLCQDEDCRTRFKREAQAAAVLEHPNIVTIHEVGEYQGRPYIVMQYVKGQSLQDVIKHKTLTSDTIVDLGIQICEGLGKAHQAGIIHRDIKPSNICLDADGRPKLVDFGLATIKGTERLTRAGSTLGTIAYMSPEQIQGKEVDHRSDLFSLGVVLYELIAGRRPFVGETEGAILNSIQNDTPEPLERYKANVPIELQRIISKLLEKDPSLRYQSAADVISDLKKLMVSRESRGGTPGPKRSFRWPLMAGIIVAAVVALIALFLFWPKEQAGVSKGKKMLAVLPFQNLGAPEDEYFADGITDEITSRLAMIQGLGVISRTSAIQYKNSKKGLPEIAKELGVNYVLEGTIRWDKAGDINRVRITPQLIKVSEDIHLWADSYERSLTQIFAVQADIATQIAEALDVALLEPERGSLEAKPTKSLEAYDYYLRGNDYAYRSYEEKDLLIAIEMYQKAVQSDPDFALAWAALAWTNSYMYWFHDFSAGRLKMVKDAVDKALELQPKLPEAHLALANYYYYGFRDYERALEELAMAQKSQPNNDHVYNAIAAIKRRQGKWEEALRNLHRATELNPRCATYFQELGTTYGVMRNFEEAEKSYDMSIAITPDQTTAYSDKSDMILRWKGDVKKARQVLEQATGKVDMASFTPMLVTLDLCDRDYESALRRLSPTTISSFEDTVLYYLTKAEVYSLLTDSTQSRAYYDSARLICESRLAIVAGLPLSLRAVATLALAGAYAGLGRKEDAIRQAQKAGEQLPISKDALFGAGMAEYRALVYVKVGKYDLAIDQLELLLSIPSNITVLWLRLDPRWDPLRTHPRFQALLKKYG
jgi:serine/threonine protein kinase/tetratricopeptide (TPR) repeat protein